MKKNCIVIIPSYKPQNDFINYALELSKSVYKIIVVNDGSGNEYNSVFNAISKIDNVILIAYSENKGKGYALKEGFKYAYNNFDKNAVIVTADCDGQHKIVDLFNVYDCAVKNPNALILGSRDFTLKNIPNKSKMGNAIMRKTFSFFYGGNVYDTQTGLRAFSNKFNNDFTKVKGDRFEYELALLIFAQKSGIEIVETKITTVYPNDPKEHKSHFKAVKDSLKVLGVMLKNISLYFISTLIAGVVDLGVFSLLSMVLFNKISPIFSLISVVVARVLSSIINYLFNFKIVFKGKEKSSIFKYYALWLTIMGLSYLNVLIFGNFLNNNLIIVKLLGDAILGILSYEIQCKWVFNSSASKFHGNLANFCKVIVKLFTKKYKTNIKKSRKPTVYVCRHLNMHGPITTLKTFNFDLHPLVLSVFFDENTAYNHLKDYTFSVKKNKSSKRHSLKAKVSAWFLVKLINSLKSVPVYRGGNKSIITLKKSLDVLNSGDSIIVFPDINYSSNYDTVSDIYDGFLLLGEMYKKKTGEDLQFVPLYIDEQNKTIVSNKPIVVNDFKTEREKAKQKIIKSINFSSENFTKIENIETVTNNNL